MKSLPAQRPSNPDVESQRPGYCVEVPSVPAIGPLFACEIDNQTHGLTAWFGGGVGFCKASGPVKVWLSLYAAQVVAQQTGGKVTTVPRFNGHVRVWQEVPG